MNTTTHQNVSLESKEGKAFLRRVRRARLPWPEEWCLHASPETDWRIVLSRTVKGDVGEPDAYVSVATDSLVVVYGESGTVKSFSDSEPVVVPAATVARLSGADVRTAAKLLLDGWRFVVTQSAGSASSSRHGLAFLSLHAENRTGDNWDSLEIGSASVLVNGCFVVRGAVQ